MEWFKRRRLSTVYDEETEVNEMFCDITDRLDDIEVLKIIALSIYGESVDRVVEKAKALPRK